MGLLDMWNSAEGSEQDIRLQGLLGGLGRMGGLLAQAGKFRPVGQPGPGMAEAFLGFGEGQRAGVASASQQAQTLRKQQQQALMADARSNKPDDQISERARAMRAGLAGLPEGIRALADDEQLPGLAIDHAKARVTPLDAARRQALGLRDGTAGGENAWTGGVNIWQQPDTVSAEAEAQRLRIARGSMQPRAEPLPVEVNGRLIDPRTGRVIYDGGSKPLPMTDGNAWNVVMRLAPQAKSGQLDPNSDEGRAYLAAQTVLTQPKPQPVVNPDGSTRMEYTTPVFPFTRLEATPAAGGAGAGAGTVIKPPPPLTESQGNATMFYNRMQEAEKRIADVQAKGYAPGNLTDTMAGRAGMAGNYVMSAPAQQYKQAASDWITAVLRKESGAVISEQEFARYSPMFFPQPGDSADVIKQKAEARASAMEGLKYATGHGAARLESAQPPPPPPPAAAPRTGEVKNGYRFRGGDPSKQESWEQIR